jgi:CheY-like chemotaxis protein
MIRKLPMIGIVDDDKIYQFTLTRIINHNKLAEKIITFSNGEEVFQYLTDTKTKNENIPDIFFIDANMPIMDGWQFMEAYATIKNEIKKKIVIFMISSSIDPVDIDRAGKISEISNYIIKPIKLEEVKVIINNFEKFL